MYHICICRLCFWVCTVCSTVSHQQQKTNSNFTELVFLHACKASSLQNGNKSIFALEQKVIYIFADEGDTDLPF